MSLARATGCSGCPKQPRCPRPCARRSTPPSRRTKPSSSGGRRAPFASRSRAPWASWACPMPTTGWTLPLAAPLCTTASRPPPARGRSHTSSSEGEAARGSFLGRKGRQLLQGGRHRPCRRHHGRPCMAAGCGALLLAVDGRAAGDLVAPSWRAGGEPACRLGRLPRPAHPAASWWAAATTPRPSSRAANLTRWSGPLVRSTQRPASYA